MERIINIPFALLLAIVPTIFWLAFYFLYSKKFTTPRKKLFKLLSFGLLVALVAAALELAVFKILPADYSFMLSRTESVSALNINDILAVFVIMFFFVAPLEEGLKYFVLRKTVFPSPKVDQIIDGIKLGVVLGLGFATIENAYYFWQAMPIDNYLQFGLLFAFRLLIATLAHSLYGGIMGYYIALAKFHKTYKNEFLIKGFVTVALIHGIFNFASFLQQTFFSITLLAITLLFVMKWYQDRFHFQSLAGKEFAGSFPPFLSERHEIEGVLFKNNVTYKVIRKLKFCPFCLKRRKKDQTYCSYCGKQLS